MKYLRPLLCLIVVFVLYRFLPKWLYLTLLLVGCALVWGYAMVKRKRFTEANKHCPHCGKDMCVQRRSHKSDTKGFVRVGGKWFKGDHVIKYKQVLYCADCQYELDI